MKGLSSFACLLLFTGHFAFAQTLPRGLSDDEKTLISEGFFKPASAVPGEFQLTDPPSTPPRAIAEWEEMQAIVITWAGYQSILKEIVRFAKEELRVIIVTTNETSVRNYLESNGIDLSENVEFINADYNSVWIRDYGGNPVYLNEIDSLALVDWIYNRPRPKDDVIPSAVADYLGVPIYSTIDAPYDLVSTGGNFMSDGRGRGFSSKLILTENGPNNVYGTSNHDESEIDTIMKKFMGINEYVMMTTLPYDSIHHIDMHMKLVDEGTLIVGKYPEGIADGPQIEANIQYVIEQFKLATGRDYRVVRMPMPPDEFGRYPDQNGYYRTYSNAMFVNKTILVPTYEEQYDTTALRIWQETMPGYKIAGINCNAIIPASGAIHCITKEVGVAKPIWIVHDQPDEPLEGDPVVMNAQIKHWSGIDNAWVFYRTSGSVEYDSLEMELDHDAIWSATLPGFAGDAVIEYYFKAHTMHGETGVRPLPAPEGFFRLHVETLPSGTTDLWTVNSRLDVFPNPADAITCISLNQQSGTSGKIALYDLQGKEIQTVYVGALQGGESKYFFDVGKMTPGYYLIRLETDQAQTCLPLVVK